MHDVDRIDWVVQAHFICYGVRFAIRANNPAALRLLKKYLPPRCRRTSPSDKDRLYSIAIGPLDERSVVKKDNVLWRDSRLLIKASNLDEILIEFESDLKLFVAENSPSGVFIHSGVVGWEGKAILIPGYSFSGKSTLVSALVQAGATYYSDEYAVIGKDGHVRPYPKPIHLRGEHADRQTALVAATRPRVREVRPIPVGLVFVSHYKPKAVWQGKEIPAGQGLLELLSHTATARRRPKASLLALQKIASRSAILKGPRGEASDTVKPLLQEVSRQSNIYSGVNNE
jgi:hypothetical protein